MPVVSPLGEHELLLFFIQFGLLLVVARALGEAAVRFRLPSVVGELLAGFVLGPSLLGAVAPGLFESIFPPEAGQAHLIEVVSWLGVLMLLVLTGLETDIGLILRKGKGAALISLGGIVVPFASGVALGFAIPRDFLGDPNKRLVFALFIGTAMSISAIPVIAKVLMELNIIRRDIGQITLAAGMIDDTVGWILLSVVAGLARSGGVSLLSVGQSILSVAGVLLVAFTVGKRTVNAVVRTLDNRVGGPGIKITALMVLTLGVGSVTHALHLEAALGAFIVGILAGQVKRMDESVRATFQHVALAVFVPIFFAASGLRVDLAELVAPRVLLVAVIVLGIATLGKFVGAYVGARSSRLGHWEALSLGAGMNARGAMEIIVATIGLNLGILSPEMYSIILMVAIVTSLMAPSLLRWTLGKVDLTDEERERLEAEDRRRRGFVSNLKRVLLPTAGGTEAETAAHVVSLLVADEEVEVTSLVLEPPAPKAADGDGASAAAHRQDRAARIERVGEHLRGHMDDIRTLVRDEGGTPWKVILEEAEKGYDLLVVGASERRSRDGTSLFHAFADPDAQQAPCPLLIVSARDGSFGTAPSEVRNILVPVSGSDPDRHSCEVAFAMARNRNVLVDLLHVVAAPVPAVQKGGGESLLYAIELGEDLLGQRAAMGRAMGAHVRTAVVVGDHPEEAVLERARHRTDFIVLAGGRRSVSQRAFFGHRIDHVLQEADCPVIVVSPY